MYSIRCLRLLVPVSWLIISIYYIIYCVILNIDAEKSLTKHTFQDSFPQYYDSIDQTTEGENLKDFLIDTPGCSIPNYMKTMKIKEAKVSKQSNCGSRTVFITKISEDEILFQIDDHKMKNFYSNRKEYTCCYQFAGPTITEGKEDHTTLKYSSCVKFNNKDIAILKKEFITVTCVLNTSQNRVIYKDAYVIIKKLDKNVVDDEQKNKKPWNVLILGMDTMSRARAYSSLPKTTEYMLQNNWLDYRAYQKVGYNTFPNVMSLLTGKKMSTIYKACSSGMDFCNHLIIWSEFKKAGYVTAAGEEYLTLPDTFSKLKFRSPPTDHYLRPFFLTGENNHGNIVCTKKTPSAKHLLNYASNFAQTYKDENFFGMFWFNSYSHNLINTPTLIDQDIAKIFSQLNEAGVTNNTFIYFLSDHGIRNGEMRLLYESYYEERLPMMFIWVPTEFQSTHLQEYNNLKINQNRLITPYDVYLTLYDTLVRSEISQEINSEACVNCTSIFNEVSIYKTCDEAGVEEKWCTCHEMTEISKSNDDVVKVTKLAVTDLQNKIRAIKSIECMKCEILELKKVLRTHAYRDESRNSTYFVLALLMYPGDVAYEFTAVKRDESINLIVPSYTISVYNTRGNCVVEPNDRAYCVCKKIEKCTKNH